MVFPQLKLLLWKVSPYGDLTFIAPLVIGFAAALWAARDRDNSETLMLGFGLCVGLIVAAKVALMIMWVGGPLRSPSGHTALAAFFYGAIALAVRARYSVFVGAITTLVCFGLVALIGVSRFMIGGHSRTETAVGLAIGGLCAWWTARRLRPLPKLSWLDILKGAALGLIVGGVVWYVLVEGDFDEERLRSFALHLRARLGR